MATKRSASAEDPLEVHTSLEFRRGKTPGIVIRHGGGSGFRYLEFALPDQAHSVRVEWNSDDYKQARANQGVPVTLIVDGGQPRKLTYNDGALYEQGRSAPVVDKKAAVVGKRFAAVFAQRGDTVRRMQRPTGPPNPTGWFGCVSEVAGAVAGLGAAAGAIVGEVSGSAAGAVAGGAAGAAGGGAVAGPAGGAAGAVAGGEAGAGVGGVAGAAAGAGTGGALGAAVGGALGGAWCTGVAIGNWIAS